VDLETVRWLAQWLGVAGAAFGGGMFGQTKAIKELRADVNEIKVRLGIAHTPKPKNGPTATVGLSDAAIIELDDRRKENRRS
jgi:hypothetical protein